jgi:hypothetical protein
LGTRVRHHFSSRIFFFLGIIISSTFFGIIIQRWGGVGTRHIVLTFGICLKYAIFLIKKKEIK